MTRWLVANTQSVQGGKIEWTISERPLLHVCSNRDIFGAMEEKGQVVRLDIRKEVEPDIIADITKPESCASIPRDYFRACFADVPWLQSWRMDAARAIKQMLEIAPVAYTISPWLLGASYANVDFVRISQRPGINNPILFVRYSRKASDSKEEA